ALGEAPACGGGTLELLGIGRQKVVERRRPFRMLDMGDRLGLAAAEHVAIELWTPEQALGGLPDRFEPLEPQRQSVRHVLGALPFRRVDVRQQQARFQVSEPGRHHQIVRRELEPQPARLLDEGEILVGQRQDRDLGEIDLLMAGQRQQEVEGPLETLDVDHQRRLVGSALRGKLGLELEFVGAHEALRASAGRSSTAANMARASATSITAGVLRAANAAAARRPASPVSGAASAATACISSSRPLPWGTRSQPAASAALARCAMEPDNASIDTSSLISSPLNPIEPRIT